MPFKSQAQRRWAHTAEGTKALGGKEKVKEWDDSTEGHLPNHASDRKKFHKFVKEHVRSKK